MAKKPDLRFTILLDGSPRRVMSVVDRKQQGLLLTLRGGAHIIKPNIDRKSILTADEVEALRIDNYYCSIHPSNESPNNLSTIKVSRILTKGVCDTAVSYTTAIKQKNGFALAFARRCGDLSHSKYNASQSKAKRNCNLGSFSSNFTLTFMVLVSDIDREFLWPSDVSRDFSIYQEKFQTCRLVLLYSFLNLPPNADSSSVPIQSIEGAPPLSGMTEMESAILFWHHRVGFRNKLISWARSNFNDDPDVKQEMNFLNFSEYFREGRTDTEEYNIYLKKIETSSSTGFFRTSYC
jgi:hypothetical protein